MADPGYQFSKKAARRIKRAVQASERARSVGSSAKDGRGPHQLRIVKVIVNEAAEGGAWYWGQILDPPQSNVDPTVDAVLADVGSAGEEVLICNTLEIGLGTHWLTDAGQNNRTFTGQVRRINQSETDGDTAVVYIEAWDWQYDCQAADTP